MSYKVGYFVGSLAKGSINRILSRALIKVAPRDLEFVEIPIGDLPLYSYDYDADYPPEARRLSCCGRRGRVDASRQRTVTIL
jgi:chromate reductase, NAD(P)H dehydrogenase (quinone)